MLTSLQAVKNWLGVTSSDDDLLLTNLIGQISGAVLNYLQRPLLTRRTYTELQSGVGNRRIMLRNWPVVDITSLTVGRLAIPPASSLGGTGYTLETWDGTNAGNPQVVSLCGHEFCRGLNNIQIVYDAGYCIEGEPHTVPTSHQITIAPALGSWAQDDGVTYANGMSLTPVASNATPTTGEYTIVPGAIGATYIFSAGDSGQNLLFNYSFTPAALEQATIEWIGERYRYKDRIGQASKSLGGNETAAYSLKGIPDFIKLSLDQYAKWLPL